MKNNILIFIRIKIYHRIGLKSMGPEEKCALITTLASKNRWI